MGWHGWEDWSGRARSTIGYILWYSTYGLIEGMGVWGVIPMINARATHVDSCFDSPSFLQ